MHSAQLFELMVALLPAIIALHLLARRLDLPPAVPLLVGGALIAFLPGLPAFTPDPELILVIFLPPLLIDGAWTISIRNLKTHLFGIASLAVGAVVFTTVVVALVTHWLFPDVPVAACAALGAIVSPPDAVSAKAVLERVKLPRRVLTLLEGESLLNDATGLVLFRFAVAAVATGTFSATQALGSFVLLAAGGAVIGAAVGALWVLVGKRLRDEYLAIAATLLVPWAAYILGELAHVSGVIATVVAGMVCGYCQYTVFSAGTRMRGTSFWTVTIFLMEAVVFMLIGLSLRGVVERLGGFGTIVSTMGGPVLLILLALLAARFAWVFFSDAFIMLLRALGMRRYTPLGARNGVVLAWAGVRGVVTLALALSLPADFPGRDFILVAAFTVILATVLIQGTTLEWLIRWTGLSVPETDKARLTRSQAEAALMQAQLQAIQSRAYDADGALLHPMLMEQYTKKAAAYSNYAGKETEIGPKVEAHFSLVLEAISASRAELLRLQRAGDIDQHVAFDLARTLDLEELNALAQMS